LDNRGTQHLAESFTDFGHFRDTYATHATIDSTEPSHSTSRIHEVWGLASTKTGVYPDPVPRAVRETVDDLEAALRTPAVFFRGGVARIVRRSRLPG